MEIDYNLCVHKKEILLLTTAHSYRAKAFMKAAERAGLKLVPVFDMPAALKEQRPSPFSLDFQQPEAAVAALVAYAQQQPVTAIMPVDDSGVLIAAEASRRLGLPHNDPQAAAAARDKLAMRRLLADGRVPVPAFQGFDQSVAPAQLQAAVAAQIGYPCVLKPRTLNGSRGVMRVDDADGLLSAYARLQRLLTQIGVAGFLIEQFMPGFEVAVEAVLHGDQLQILALFDKPDPLDGPFFEETIYLTPSRLSPETQTAVADMTLRGAKALGLQTGSVHAELRINEKGVWIVEVNGRSIGGLCSQTLRFDMAMSLEELLLRQAAGQPVTHLKREQKASGVMMIPIPKAGILREYTGLEAAEQIPGIDDINITAPLHNPLVPLPEGESYLGFIFASGTTPALVESSLRQAHACLHFQIDETLPLVVETKSF